MIRIAGGSDPRGSLSEKRVQLSVRVCGCIRREGAARRVAGEVVQGDEAFIPESASGNHSRNPSYEPRVIANLSFTV